MSFGEKVIRFRWPVIALSILIVALSAIGASRLEMITDERVYFADDDPMLAALDRLDNIYSKDKTVTIALEPDDGNVFTAKTLAAVEWITEKAWEFPYSTRADSLSNYQHTYVTGDDLLVVNLVSNPLELTDEKLKEIREIALSEPELAGKLVSLSGRVTGINVTITKPGKSLDEETKVAEHVYSVMDQFREKFPGIKVHLSGDVIFNAAFLKEANEDMAVLIPAMFIVMVLVIAVTLRSLWGTIATVIIIIASTLTGMGISGWIGIPMGDVASMAPTIVMTLAVADSIHILSTAFQLMRTGMEKKEALEESLKINLPPVFLTSITTALGFLSMNLGESPTFHDLGNMVVLGVLSAFVFSIHLLPALIMIFPIKFKPVSDSAVSFSELLGRFVIRNRKALFYGMAAFLLFTVSGIPRIYFDDKFIEYISKDSKVRQATEFIGKNLVGLDLIEFSLDSGEEGGISDPGYLAKVEEFATWFRSQPKVTHVTSINGIMKRLNKTMHGDAKEWYRVPDNRELAAQYLLLYEMSLPFGLDLNSRLNLDKSASRFSVNVANVSSMEIVELQEKADEWIENNMPPHMQTKAAGWSVMFAHLTERNVKSMVIGTGAALILISAILMFALKSVKIGFVSLIPNLAPVAMAFGLWGLLFGEVGLGIAVVAAMTLGIVVDDTVHFLSKYMRAKRVLGMKGVEAVLYSFNTVGAAIMTTSIILVSGFLVLAFSSFKVNAEMGVLTAITIFLAMMADFLFLPPLLLKLEGRDG